MNIHPILVHFPIALLSLYAILEIIRNKKLNKNSAYLSVKAFLVIAGTVGAIASYVTGDSAASSLSSQLNYAIIHPIIRIHEDFAQYTVIVFILITLSYLLILSSELKMVRNMRRHWLSGELRQNVWNFFYRIAEFIQRPAVITSLAFAGLILVVITGTLGGLIVYGPNADPFVNIATKLFFPSLLAN